MTFNITFQLNSHIILDLISVTCSVQYECLINIQVRIQKETMSSHRLYLTAAVLCVDVAWHGETSV